MRWNCPHCSTALSVADNALGPNWSFAQCYKCQGFALVRQTGVSVVKVDRAPQFGTAPGAMVPQPAPAAEAAAAAPSLSASSTSSPASASQPQLMNQVATQRLQQLRSLRANRVGTTPAQGVEQSPQHAKASAPADIAPISQAEAKGPMEWLERFASVRSGLAAEQASRAIDARMLQQAAPVQQAHAPQAHAPQQTTVETAKFAPAPFPEPLPEIPEPPARIAVAASSPGRWISLLTARLRANIGMSSAALIAISSGLWLLSQGQSLVARTHSAGDDEAPVHERLAARHEVTAAESENLTPALRRAPTSDSLKKSAMAPSREAVPSAEELITTSSLIVKPRQSATLYEGPANHFPIAGTVQKDVQLNVVDWNQEWFKVSLGSKFGWIKREFVQVFTSPQNQ